MGRKIHYRAEGRGPLVILLHAAASHSGQWKPYIEALKDRYRVIAPDMHGYGRSESLPKTGPWFAHDALIPPALVAAEGRDRAHLIGHSLGASNGFFAVRNRADLFESLLMIEPVLFMFLEQIGDPLAYDQAGLGRALDPFFCNGRSGRRLANLCRILVRRRIMGINPAQGRAICSRHDHPG